MRLTPSKLGASGGAIKSLAVMGEIVVGEILNLGLLPNPSAEERSRSAQAWEWWRALSEEAQQRIEGRFDAEWCPSKIEARREERIPGWHVEGQERRLAFKSERPKDWLRLMPGPMGPMVELVQDLVHAPPPLELPSPQRVEAAELILYAEEMTTDPDQPEIEFGCRQDFARRVILKVFDRDYWGELVKESLEVVGVLKGPQADPVLIRWKGMSEDERKRMFLEHAPKAASQRDLAQRVAQATEGAPKVPSIQKTIRRLEQSDPPFARALAGSLTIASREGGVPPAGK